MDNLKLHISALLLGAILCVAFFTPSIANVPQIDPIVTPTSNVGTLKGNFQVTPTGQAHYSIPIDVPQGTAKMQPVLSIGYDSTSSNIHNGPLGMGFSIEGLSAITRCQSNKTQNGAIHGVAFKDTYEDRFCLNGEQLVAIKGVYGADGTEYRTYHDSKTKIISYGRVGNGPASFKVWTKGGQLATYGADAGSQIYAQGKSTIATWALTKITDTVGNYLVVSYLKDGVNGAFYPAEIDYTGNVLSNVKPYNSVVFSYEARPDKAESYVAGSVTRIVQRLKNIQVNGSGKTIANYNFTYEISPNSYRSRITSIQKCSADGVCLPPTTFEWQTNEEGWEEAPSGYALDFLRKVTPEGSALISLDASGVTGFVQNYYQENKSPSPDMHRCSAWINDGLGWQKHPLYNPPFEIEHKELDPSEMQRYGSNAGTRFVDLRGTGYDDVIQEAYYGDQVRHKGAQINNGHTWIPYPNYIPPVEFSSKGRDEGARFISLMGSGLPDLVQNVFEPGYTHVAALENTGSGWKPLPDAYNPPLSISYFGYGPKFQYGTDAGTRFLDLRGIGLDDEIEYGVVSASDVRKAAYLNTGTGWEIASHPRYVPPVEIADLGRDAGVRFIHLTSSGLPDMVQNVVYPTVHQIGAWINDGDGWVPADSKLRPPVKIIWFSSSRPFNEIDQGARFADLRGTGLDDVVQNYGFNNYAFINTGLKWEERDKYKVPYYTSAGTFDTGFRFVDLTGSGLPDVLKVGPVIHGALFNKAKKYPDYLVAITDGLGAKLEIDYESLSTKNSAVSVYTKEQVAKYPNMDWQGPMYVVYQTKSGANINDPQAILRACRTNNYSADALKHITTYHYTGAKLNHLGLGFLGFHQVSSTDKTTGLTTTTTYSQDIKAQNVGSPLATETRLNDADQTLISSSKNIWDLKTYGDGKPNTTYYSPYVKTTIKNSYTLTGKQISTETTDNTLDDFGNPLTIVTEIKDIVNGKTFTTSTVNTYSNDLAKWYIGELTSATVTKEGTNIPAQTRTSSFTYDKKTSLLIKSIAEPNDEKYTLTTSYERDPIFGNVISTTVSGKGIESRTTKVTYDTNGRFVLSTTNPLEQTTSQTYDQNFGTVLTATDLNKLTTQYQYDGFGRLVKQTTPEGVPTDTSFNWVDLSKIPLGEIHDALLNVSYVVITHTRDSTTQKEYFDRLGRKVATTTQNMDGKNIWQLYYYDELDRLTEKSLPFFEGETVYKNKIYYDDLGRVIQTISPDKSVTNIFYDGFKTTTINQLKQQQIKQVNALGQLIKTTDNFGNITSYEYDAYGNMLSMDDGAGHVSKIEYDFLGRKTAIKDPDKGHWTYDYDVLGELNSQTDALSHTTTFKYDKLGRTKERIDPAATSTWEYDTAVDGVGKIAKVVGVAGLDGKVADPIGVLKAKYNGVQSYTKVFVYDQYSRPKQTTTTINGVDYISSQDYDLDSRVNTQTYPNSLKIQNNYNNLGFLVKINNFNTKQDYWKLNATDAAGHIISETHSNGLITSYTYDPETNFLTDIDTALNSSLQLQKKLFPGTTGLTAKHQHFNKPITNDDPISGKVIQSEKYSYDVLGDVKTHADKVNSVNDTYTYDGLNRLKTATGSTNETFEYDNLGNVKYKSDVGTYNYGENAGPHAVTAIKGLKESTFHYDANGDQTSATIAGVTRSITYSSFSKPLNIVTPSATVNFYYNADRQSFERVDHVGNKTVTTYYLGDYEVETTEVGTKVTTEQKAYIGGSTICVKMLDEAIDATKIYTTLHNNIGSLTDITDQNGNVLQHFTYTPFGEQKQTKGQILDNPITHRGFTGHEEIEKVNLIHMNGRIYDPVIGRFLTADPFVQAPENSQSLNRYSYCLNNPLAITDPSGFYSWKEFKNDAYKLFHSPVGRIMTGIAIGIVGGLIPGVGAMTACTIGTMTTILMGAFEGVGINQILFEGVVTAASLGVANALQWLDGCPDLSSKSATEIAKEIGKKALPLGGSAGGELEKTPIINPTGGATITEGDHFYDKSFYAAMLDSLPIGNAFSLSQEEMTSIFADRAGSNNVGAAPNSNYSNGAKSSAYREIIGKAIGYAGDALMVAGVIVDVASAAAEPETLGASSVGFVAGSEMITAGRAIKAGATIYRVFGGEAKGMGRYWTDVAPDSVSNYRGLAGLPDSNSGSFIAEGRLQNIEGVVSRSAAPLGGNPGGLSEIFVPHPEEQIIIDKIYGLNPPY